MENYLVSYEENQQLLSRCFSGHREAGEIFVRQFSDLVYKSIQQTFIARQIHFRQEDLENLHHTFFMQLFEKKCKKLKEYKGRNGCSLASWIRIVTVRIVLNHIRKKGLDTVSYHNKMIPSEDLNSPPGKGAE